PDVRSTSTKTSWPASPSHTCIARATAVSGPAWLMKTLAIVAPQLDHASATIATVDPAACPTLSSTQWTSRGRTPGQTGDPVHISGERHDWISVLERLRTG